MILDNFNFYLSERLKVSTGLVVSNVSSIGGFRGKWKNPGEYVPNHIEGILNNVVTQALNYNGSTNSSNFYSGVIFGDGSTHVTKSDYNLAGNHIKTLSAIVQITRSVDENGVEIKAVYSLTNTGTTDVVIAEMAMLERILSGLTTESNNNRFYFNYIIDRKVLDAPVTIPAGGVGQVTYTIRVNYPTA